MGLNLYVYALETTKGNKLVSKEEYSGWDTARYSGDREFDQNDLPVKYVHDEHEYYWRPDDFAKWRIWVTQNILKANQKRLLDVLDLMSKQEDLYFYSSY